MDEMSLPRYGSHIAAPYSRTGRTRLVQAFSLIFLGQVFKFLRRKARVPFDFLVVEATCLDQSSLFVMFTPR